MSKTVFYGNALVVDSYGEIHESSDNESVVIESAERDNKERFQKGDDFMKMFLNTIPKLTKELTPTELSFLLALTPHVSYVDCVIRNGKECRGNISNEKEIAEMIGMEHGKVRRLVSSLIKKGVIGKHETGSILPEYYGRRTICYTVNPYIFFKGTMINRTVLEAYRNSGWNSEIEIEPVSEKAYATA